MNLLVLNGSPKGRHSITLQYARYLAARHPEHSWTFRDISRSIFGIERREALRQANFDTMAQADAIVFCFPVYFLSVPAQLKRFVELLFECDMGSRLQGKFATSLSTSAHFYDHLAHEYLHAISEDLGMRYLEGYSPEGEDLTQPSEQRRLERFGLYFLRQVAESLDTPRKFSPVSRTAWQYVPTEAGGPGKTGRHRIVVVQDATSTDVNLRHMVDVFGRHSVNSVDVISLDSSLVRGGCFGCMRCCAAGQCVYRDGFRQVVDERIRTADAIVYAATVRDRLLSAQWKAFLDRHFFNGHRPLYAGKQMAHIITGPLRSLPNLRQMLEALPEIGLSNLVGIVTDEDGNSEALDARLIALARRVDLAFELTVQRPQTFLGVGGWKVFRDLVYENSFPLDLDHRHFRVSGLYDFPQSKFKQRTRNWLLRSLLLVPGARHKVFGSVPQRMVERVKAVADRVSAKSLPTEKLSGD